MVFLGKAFDLKTSGFIDLNNNSDQNNQIEIGPYKILALPHGPKKETHSIERSNNINDDDLVEYLNQVEEQSSSNV